MLANSSRKCPEAVLVRLRVNKTPRGVTVLKLLAAHTQNLLAWLASVISRKHDWALGL